MAKLNFGGVEETVITREEFPLGKALEVLKDETIAVIGYGVQGPGQGLDLRDNGFNVIVGQRPGKTYDKAVADGWTLSRNQSLPLLPMLLPLPDPIHDKHPLPSHSSSFQHHQPIRSMLKMDVPQPSPLPKRAHIMLWLPPDFSLLHHTAVVLLDTVQDYSSGYPYWPAPVLALPILKPRPTDLPRTYSVSHWFHQVSDLIPHRTHSVGPRCSA